MFNNILFFVCYMLNQMIKINKNILNKICIIFKYEDIFKIKRKL